LKPKRSSMHDTGARIHYVRLYHFLSADHALDDIANRRLKISQIEELNDPFELWCVYQKDRKLRDALRAYKDQMAARFGVLCFSKHGIIRYCGVTTQTDIAAFAPDSTSIVEAQRP